MSSEELIKVLEWRMTQVEEAHKAIQASLAALPGIIDAKMEKRGERGWERGVQVITLLVALTAAYFSASHSVYESSHPAPAAVNYKVPSP